jgi:hypothetical protein
MTTPACGPDLVLRTGRDTSNMQSHRIQQLRLARCSEADRTGYDVEVQVVGSSERFVAHLDDTATRVERILLPELVASLLAAAEQASSGVPG